MITPSDQQDIKASTASITLASTPEFSTIFTQPKLGSPRDCPTRQIDLFSIRFTPPGAIDMAADAAQQTLSALPACRHRSSRHRVLSVRRELSGSCKRVRHRRIWTKVLQ